MIRHRTEVSTAPNLNLIIVVRADVRMRQSRAERRESAHLASRTENRSKVQPCAAAEVPWQQRVLPRPGLRLYTVPQQGDRRQERAGHLFRRR